MRDVKITKLADGFVFPEGPVWHPDGYLIFSDIHGSKIYKLNEEARTAEPWFDEGKKTNGLIMSLDGGKVYACGHGDKAFLEIDAKTRKSKVLAADFRGRKFLDVNDVAVDSSGNVFFTDPKWGKVEPGEVQGVYCLAKTGELKFAAEIDQQPNGIVVSRDQKHVYVARSGGSDIWRFQLGQNGDLAGGEQWFKLEDRSVPDGMTLDSKGNLYVALAGNGKLIVISPSKQVLHEIKIFSNIATNCELHPDDESVVYVTGGGRIGHTIGAVYRVDLPKQ